ncbi:glycosyltransferase family 87 protein [Dietzia sp.]|uniref:glycosyltransferase family 87 protein n=1 Tax=Dietzia sp. TaxID=1871616 RepID=UPI002FDB4BB4
MTDGDPRPGSGTGSAPGSGPSPAAGAAPDPDRAYRSPRALAPDESSLAPEERHRPGDGPLLPVAEAWGGPLGKHAVVGRQRWVTPLRVVLLFAVIFLAFGFFSKAGCLETTHPTDGSEPSLMWDGRQYYKACYADPIPLWGVEGLSQGAFPYKFGWVEGEGADQITRYMEYPVLTGLWQYASAQVALGWDHLQHMGALPGPIPVIKYFSVVVVGMAFFWLLAVWATYRSTGRRPWDTLFMAASPLVIFQAFTNFDAMAVAASALALMFWSRRMPKWAGFAIGIGVAMKLYPLFLFGALLVVALRARKYVDLLWAICVAVLTWSVVNLPIALLFPEGWREFFRLNNDRPQNPESIYAAISGLTSWGGFDAPGEIPSTLNTVSLVLFAAGCVGVLAIGLTARKTPRIAQLAFLIVAIFLLTNKVWSPQYSLWLVPLAVLAIPRARVLLPWMVFDALLWVAHMSYFAGTESKGLNPEWFHLLVLIRDGLVVYVCAAIVWEIYRPSRDLVRRWHADLPGGDPLLGTLAPGGGDGGDADAAVRESFDVSGEFGGRAPVAPRRRPVVARADGAAGARAKTTGGRAKTTARSTAEQKAAGDE